MPATQLVQAASAEAVQAVLREEPVVQFVHQAQGAVPEADQVAPAVQACASAGDASSAASSAAASSARAEEGRTMVAGTGRTKVNNRCTLVHSKAFNAMPADAWRLPQQGAHGCESIAVARGIA